MRVIRVQTTECLILAKIKGAEMHTPIPVLRTLFKAISIPTLQLLQLLHLLLFDFLQQRHIHFQLLPFLPHLIDLNGQVFDTILMHDDTVLNFDDLTDLELQLACCVLLGGTVLSVRFCWLKRWRRNLEVQSNKLIWREREYVLFAVDVGEKGQTVCNCAGKRKEEMVCLLEVIRIEGRSFGFSLTKSNLRETDNLLE